MHKSIVFILILFISINAKAEKILYPVNEIPKNLLVKADAVKRIDHTEFTLINTRSTKMLYHYVITILNESGDVHSNLVVAYDKLTRINFITGFLYNAQGELIKKLKNKDIKDYSAVDDISLAEDSRVKVHNFNYKSYPYTIEYEIETEGNQTFFLPSWTPQTDEFLSVEKSDFIITYPERYIIRYKVNNYSSEPEKVLEKGNVKLTFTKTSLPAIKAQFSTAWYDLITFVNFAPSEFEIAGYKGNLNSWEEFGHFQNSLNKGRDVLPPDIIQQVKKLTEGVVDVKDKVKIIYEYLQKNTRYISIQLGIGGWQPFEATYVSKNGYGDCKALTNYMYSMLKAANIASNYTVVFAGSSGFAKNRFAKDFSSSQFNHVILCVPNNKDSIWLECTSQQSPAGYMGGFTGNRQAVMMTDKGGVVVSTPRYGINENKQIRSIEAKLDEEGTLNMKSNTTYSCLQQDRLSGMLNALSDQKVKEQLEKSLSLSTYQINNFNYKQNKSSLPSVEEKLDVTVHNYATITGKRIFLTPNILNRSGYQLTADSLRKTDFVFDIGEQDQDEIKIEIPEGYEIESRPKDITLETKFGKYTISSKIEGNSIIYHRTNEQYSGRFPASMQDEVINFYNEIFKSDRAKIVFVKK